MAKRSFAIAFRHLRQNKLYSVINVIGLAIGVWAMLLSMMYWRAERSFDTFHTNNPDLYRITTTLSESKDEPPVLTGGTGQVQGPAFKQSIADIKAYTRVLGGNIQENIQVSDKVLRLQLLFADSSFFNVFSFPLLSGNAHSALTTVSSAVVSKSTALKLFHTTDVIGREINMNGDPSASHLGRPLIISAVADDPPANSSIRFDIVLPMSFMQLSFQDDNWTNSYLGTFIVLNHQADVPSVIKKFQQVHLQHAGSDPSSSVIYGLQRMTDVYLHPLRITGEGGVALTSNPVYSYVFLIVTVFILLMAAVNFTNITIGNSLKRVREVGIRKILGGKRLDLIAQFLIDAALLVTLSFFVAVVFTALSLPLLEEVTGMQALWRQLVDVNYLGSLLTFFCVVVLCTSVYPAYVLSNFNAKEVIAGKIKLSGRQSFGRVLVVVQVSLAVIVLIACVVYYRQMHFIQTIHLGYNPDQVMITTIEGERPRKPIRTFLRDELLREPGVQRISFGGGQSEYPVHAGPRTVKAIHVVIDEDYFPLLQIPFVKGRNLSTHFASDSNYSVIVNQAFIKSAGLQHPIGTQVTIDNNFTGINRTIVGVVKDFHHGSLREPIVPMVFFKNEEYGDNVYMKFDQLRQQHAAASLERVYKKAMPEAAFQYQLLNEANANAYIKDRQWQRVILIATGLSLFICCLGLFGMAHLTTQQRVKEIGIRKLLGASVQNIVSLIAIHFLKLVMIAFVIAAPISWWIMHQWLQNFAYHVAIGVGIFIVAALLAISMTVMAVGFQAMKAAMSNPVKSLRSE